MPNVKGRGIRVEIAATFGTAKVVTAVTKANPGVATSTAHAMTANTVGYFDTVVGMVQLEKQACRVKNPTANAFDLQGLNTTNYSDFTSGNFIPVATWQTLAEATSYRFGGGSAEKLNATRLIDIVTEGYLREGKRYVTIAVGCTGGRHRSVAMVEHLAARLVKKGVDTYVVHRDIEKDG